MSYTNTTAQYDLPQYVLSDVPQMQDFNKAFKTISENMGKGGNDNFLDDWYFADPVNQRGQTSYDTHASPAYGIDRWWSIFTSATIQQDGILIKTNADAAYAGTFRQAIGEAKQLAGKTVTLSLLLKEVSGTVTLGLARANGLNTGIVAELPGVNTSSAGLLSVTGTLSQNVGSSETPVLLTSISCSKGGTCKMVAAKLELGDKQTLAYQDANGNWVLNDPPPNKALELAKCQRYFKRIKPSSRPNANIALGYAYATSATTAWLTIPVADLRIAPAIIVSDITKIGLTKSSIGNMVSYAGSVVSGYMNYNGETLQFLLGELSGLTTGDVYLAWLVESSEPSYIDLDANL